MAGAELRLAKVEILGRGTKTYCLGAPAHFTPEAVLPSLALAQLRELESCVVPPHERQPISSSTGA